MTSDGDPNPLISLLRDCVVRIDAEKGFRGTGFFVSPGRVITCAHVVHGVAGLAVSWKERTPVPASAVYAAPRLDSFDGRGHYPLPDVAVIDLDLSAGPWDHPCVRLATDRPVLNCLGSMLYLVGYTDELTRFVPALTGVSTVFEGEVFEEAHKLYKFKNGQIRPGLSGSPLLDPRSGTIVGITEATRNKMADLGGFAVPVTELTALPDVVAANQEFHCEDRRWETAVEAEHIRAHNRAELGLLPAVLKPPSADGELSPTVVFSPRYPIVGYVGSRRLLDDLAAWRDHETADGAPVGLWFVKASGGYGKTRLAVEACVEAEALGWTTGLLPVNPRDDNIRALAEWPGRLLLVVDDAEAWPKNIARLVSELASRRSRRPVRILLLVRRDIGQRELHALFNERHEEELASLLREAPVSLLDKGGVEVDRIQLFRRASADFAAWTASATGIDVRAQDSAEPLPSLRAPHFARPLYVLAAAYLHLKRQPSDAEVDMLGETELLRALLKEHEAQYWNNVATRRRLPLEQEDQRNAVAVATLLTAEGKEEALAVARLVPHLSGESEPRLMAVARWLGELYAATTANGELRIAPLQPDRLGEVLVADLLNLYPDLLSAALDVASDRQSAHLLAIVTRAAVDDSVVEDCLSRALDERLVDLYLRGMGAGSPAPGQASPELFNAVVVAMIVSKPVAGAIALDECLTLALPRRLQDHAVGVAELAVEGLRKLAGRDPSRERELITGLSRLSSRLRMMGQWEEAAERAREAVSRCRESAADRHSALQTTSLAVSLVELVEAQRKLGLLPDTEALADESVALCRALAAANPPECLPYLGAALRNLARVLGDGPRHAEGLAAAGEAVSIDRGLSAGDPLLYLPGLAESLAALAVAHRKAGQPTSAVETAKEAIAIFRSVSKTRGDAYQLELAESLGTLAGAQFETEPPDEALSTAGQAVHVLRQLTENEDSPDGYRAALARSLQTWAVMLAETGRPSEALDLSQEAVGICRRLAGTKPGAYHPDLASALTGLGAAWWRAGRLEDALAASHEAMSIHRSIAESDPDGYRPERARLLTHRAVYLADARIGGEALSAAREAVHEYRQLATVSAGYRNDLAAALTNLAGILGEADHADEAVRTATEAVELYEEPTGSLPFADVPVFAGSLHALATLLLATGPCDKAVDSARQAVDLLRLAAERSPGEIPALAASMHTLAVCLSSAGRPEESLRSERNAVSLYRELAAASPTAYAGRFAEGLGTLATLLDDVGRRSEAEDLFAENLAHFAETPDMVASILLARGRHCMTHGDLSAAVDDLSAAARAADDAGDRPVRSQARRYLCHLRQQDTSSFDRAWERRQVPLPMWLEHLGVSDQLIRAVSDWAGITVPAESRVHLEGHAAILLTDEAEAVLEHLIDANPGTGFLDSRLKLLQAVRAGGIANAYEDLTRQVLQREKTEILEAWLSGGSWQVCRDFACAHADDLVHPITMAHFDGICTGRPDIHSFRLHRGILHFAAEAPDAAAGFRDAYDLGLDAGRLRALLTDSDPPLSGPTRLALARMYSGQYASEPEAHFLLATVLLGGEGSDEEEFGPGTRHWRATSVGSPVSLGPDLLAEVKQALADCADNAVPYERRDCAERLAGFLARRSGLEPYAAEFQHILIGASTIG
ncbi:hypothetical protein ABH935_002702 [Catenulispora sp. GAS73]|uniref:tetratricopeptide repeat protein n=1 Tax=Catenulispora sp. GAS73 TaxID=3156269 RepID=UPI003519BC2C